MKVCFFIRLLNILLFFIRLVIPLILKSIIYPTTVALAILLDAYITLSTDVLANIIIFSVLRVDKSLETILRLMVLSSLA